MSEPPALILDTNIFIDALVFKRSSKNRPSVELLNRIAQGRFKAIIPAPVLLEVYDVVLRYTHDVGKAEEALRYMLNATNTEFCPISLDHSLIACEFFRDVNFNNDGAGRFVSKNPRTEKTLSAVDGLVLSVGMDLKKTVCSKDGLFKDVTVVDTKSPDEVLRFLSINPSTSPP